MKKIILCSIMATFLLTNTVVAHAEEDEDVEVSATVNTSVQVKTPNPVPPKPKVFNAQPLKAAIQANKDIREEKREDVQDIRMKIASTSKEQKDMRMKMASSSKEDRKDLKERIASSTKEKRDDRREIVKIRIESRFKIMFNRLQATIDREIIIMGKINSRIEKIKAAGGTGVTEAEKLTAEAKHHLEEAQTALNLLKTTATSETELEAQVQASSTGASITKDTLSKMQKAGKEVEKHIREAHQALQKTIGVLRGNSQVNATTSANIQN